MTYDKTDRAINRTADKLHEAVDTARETAQQASDAAGSATVRERVEDVKERAQQIGAQAAEKADAATTTVGNKMTDAAEALRQHAPESGRAGEVADKAADTLERAGSYLQQQDLSGMRSDLEQIIRKHPVEALLVGFGVGFLLARGSRH